MASNPATRRRCVQLLGALGLALAAPWAPAQDWPAKPIRIVSPYAPGGVGDTIFRLLAPALEARLGQRFVIDNKTGAAGNIGTGEVVRAAPDGYTFLMAPTANFAVNQHLFKLGFDPLTQLEPVAAIAEAPLIAVTGTGVTATSLKQLSEQVKAGKGKFNYGSPGAGSPTHLAGASFSLMHSGALEHVSYRGTPPMVQALLAGDIQLSFPTLTPVLGQLKAGKLNALAVMSRQRMPELPNVPSAVEAGFPDLVFGNWWVLAAPKGTPGAIVNRLNVEIRTLLADPAIRSKLGEMGHVAMDLNTADTANFVRAESAKYRTLIERTGIKLD
jgi:tripartite-type tricarboxylate transporter receptor subunit TctC